MSADAVEAAWCELLQEQEAGINVPKCPVGESTARYDAAVRAVQAVQQGPREASSLLRALRLALALGVDDQAWVTYLDHHLSALVRQLRSQDAEFAVECQRTCAPLRIILQPGKVQLLPYICSIVSLLWTCYTSPCGTWAIGSVAGCHCIPQPSQ